MKKNIIITVALGLFLALTSCTKDDAPETAASLIGKWEFSKEGVASGGQEVLVDYEHSTGCPKDFSTITATTIVDTYFYGSNCAQDITNTAYTRSGNIISAKVDGVTQTVEIKTLDTNTLKIYGTDPDSPQLKQVIVFTRVK